jgi:hypothetical protein
MLNPELTNRRRIWSWKPQMLNPEFTNRRRIWSWKPQMLNPEAHVWSSSVTDRKTACSKFLTVVRGSDGQIRRIRRLWLLPSREHRRLLFSDSVLFSHPTFLFIPGVYTFHCHIQIHRTQYQGAMESCYLSGSQDSYSLHSYGPNPPLCQSAVAFLVSVCFVNFQRPGDYLLLWPSSYLIHFFLFANFTSLQSQS